MKSHYFFKNFDNKLVKREASDGVQLPYKTGFMHLRSESYTIDDGSGQLLYCTMPKKRYWKKITDSSFTRYYDVTDRRITTTILEGEEAEAAFSSYLMNKDLTTEPEDVTKIKELFLSGNDIDSESFVKLLKSESLWKGINIRTKGYINNTVDKINREGNYSWWRCAKTGRKPCRSAHLPEIVNNLVTQLERG